MSLALPGYFAAALAAAVAVAALHLLAWRRPTPSPLPTARFAPSVAVRAVSRDVRLSDALLLAVRVLALLLAGLAMSRPLLVGGRHGVARVIVMDASRSVAGTDEVEDSARAHAEGADATSYLRVDSMARLLSDSVLGPRIEARGTLTAGLIVAVREARRLQRRYEHVVIVIVSPFARESWDEATLVVRREWPSPVVAVPVAARPTPVRQPNGALPIDRHFPPVGDPVGAAFALAARAGMSRALHVVRGAASPSDSQWAALGGVLVSWPESPTMDSTMDAIVNVITTTGVTVSGRFARMPNVRLNGQTIARWGNGVPAVSESVVGHGCIRSVGFSPAGGGDAMLQPAFLRLVQRLAAFCDEVDWTPIGAAALAQLAEPVGTPSVTKGVDGVRAESARNVADALIATNADAKAAGAKAAGAGTAFASGETRTTPNASWVGRAPDAQVGSEPVVRWLLALTFVALALEWWLREHRRSTLTTRSQSAVPGAREAA